MRLSSRSDDCWSSHIFSAMTGLVQEYRFKKKLRNREPSALTSVVLSFAPYLWFVWGWWWCLGWTACYFPLHTPPYSVSSQEMVWILILRGKSTGCRYYFVPEQQQTIFFYINCNYYEQASSRTLWLKAFPCKPCKRWLLLSLLFGTQYQGGSFSLIDVGSGFHCLRSFCLFLLFIILNALSHRHLISVTIR